MAPLDTEIVVDDPDAPEELSPPVVRSRTIDIFVYLMLLALAALLAYDNWQTGAGWASDGPQAGYFPFYLSLMLAGASLFGLITVVISRAGADKVFVTRAQLRRVSQVAVPTLLYCILTQWLGIYVASFLLTLGFMGIIGRIAWWKSLLTAAVFSILMFVTFEIAFDVIMPMGPLETYFGY